MERADKLAGFAQMFIKRLRNLDGFQREEV
jgi:hypothetical protein